MDTEHGVAAWSEPVKGALVPAVRGTKVASMSGAKEPYITSAEAVEFSVVCSRAALLSAWNKRPTCWKALENRISPGKVGSRRVGIGAIDPGTTVEGNNAERTYRL